MYRIVVHRLALAIYCLAVASIALMLFSSISILPAYAASNGSGNPQVSITLPMVNGIATGHPGTQVTFSGSGFTPGTGNLYTTTNSDPAKCTNNGNPDNLGLTPFSTHPSVFIKGDGSFEVQSTWPNNAANANAQYYICVVKHGSDALSKNTFTVAAPATVSVTPTTVAPGGQVTVTGSNWLPPQALSISIMAGNNSTPIVQTSASPAANGNLDTPLTIPAAAPQGTYSIVVVAQNETTMNATASNALTVAAPTATPSPSSTTPPSPTLTPTQAIPAPTTTPTTNNNGSSGSAGISNAPILFILIGIGTLLVIGGGILFVVYGRIR